MSAPRPFSGADYDRNRARVGEGATACANCGRPVLHPWPASVHVIDGGASYATEEQSAGRTPIDEAGDMGAFPLGSDCARKLRAAGVYVMPADGAS